MNQPTLFDEPDPGAAARAKAEGIAQADAGAPDAFRKGALECIVWLAALGEPFTADDVWMMLERTGGPLPPTPAALGPVFLRAARLGYVTKTGRMVSTVFKRRHRDLTEWIGPELPGGLL